MYLFSKILIFLLGSLFGIAVYAAPVDIPPSEIQNHGLSVEQLQQAAEAGDPDAQYALGYLYYYGKNVPQNTQTGLNWIKRASVQGQEQAAQALQVLSPSTGNVQTKIKAVVATTTTTNLTTPENEALTTTSQNSAVATKKVVVKSSAPGANKVTSITTTTTKAHKSSLNNYYTIQLLVTSSKAELNRYIQTHKLSNKANYHPMKKGGYVLLYGNYKTRAEAQAALLKLPAAVKAQKPWIKQMDQVRSEIKGA